MVVVLLVQGMKKLGVRAKWASWAELGLSAGVAVVIALYKEWPEVGRYLGPVGVALLVWLTAIGIYEKGREVLVR